MKYEGDKEASFSLARGPSQKIIFSPPFKIAPYPGQIHQFSSNLQIAISTAMLGFPLSCFSYRILKPSVSQTVDKQWKKKSNF